MQGPHVLAPGLLTSSPPPPTSIQLLCPMDPLASLPGPPQMPRLVDHIFLAPGNRAELLVKCSGAVGKKYVLRAQASAGPGCSGGHVCCALVPALCPPGLPACLPASCFPAALRSLAPAWAHAPFVSHSSCLHPSCFTHSCLTPPVSTLPVSPALSRLSCAGTGQEPLQVRPGCHHQRVCAAHVGDNHHSTGKPCTVGCSCTFCLRGPLAADLLRWEPRGACSDAAVAQAPPSATAAAAQPSNSLPALPCPPPHLSLPCRDPPRRRPSRSSGPAPPRARDTPPTFRTRRCGPRAPPASSPTRPSTS